ncbi:hypothetical protein XAP412_460015 [Xanthomonas phaseoli pv. phaseoli]|uniref:Secreted protein n=1 Tax=Xanthomonas campestris pv. phaseoli TaxID=317013 RepID=A0AB38E1I8_XANCH|nr:hypothetical protein XAP6984_510014 [Xanthomonas phaseoli pv. phaseoli]SON85962.1 hypothetical protein XAP412_460015 [Xanthomonas phaseoli pv. phaseoli]SON90445.1 hypothetical protein XAP7430_480015 [Xanthomonas phaseoli pv. phaseoli]
MAGCAARHWRGAIKALAWKFTRPTAGALGAGRTFTPAHQGAFQARASRQADAHTPPPGEL